MARRVQARARASRRCNALQLHCTQTERARRGRVAAEANKGTVLPLTVPPRCVAGREGDAAAKLTTRGVVVAAVVVVCTRGARGAADAASNPPSPSGNARMGPQKESGGLLDGVPRPDRKEMGLTK